VGDLEWLGERTFVPKKLAAQSHGEFRNRMLIIDTVGIKRLLCSLTTKYSMKLKNLPFVVLPYAGRAE
jgi:hypothetical protein